MNLKRFERWRKDVEEAIIDIENLVKEENEAGHLANWLLNHNANRYSFSPDKTVGDLLGSALGFNTLCSSIHHALFDDGDITFFTVSGNPQFIFLHRLEKEFKQACLNSAQKYCAEKYGAEYDIKIIKDAYEFTKVFDEDRKDWLKKCFLNDCKKNSKDLIKYYSEHKEYKDIFDPEWIKELR